MASSRYTYDADFDFYSAAGAAIVTPAHILGFARPTVAVADLRLDQFSQIRETRVGPAASIDKWKIIVIID
jgi:hypothetical protein